ncbi:MAG: tetratricopeptide repeat protein [Planctomycetota bacterium]
MRYKMPLFVFLICSLGLPVLFAQDDEDLQIRPLDIVELINGNRFEGRILSERTDGIQLEMAGGTATFLRADIARVLHRNPPEKVYEVKIAKNLDPESYQSQLELGQWCLDPQVNLLELAIGHLQDAVRLSPSSPVPYELLFPIYDVRDTNGLSVEDRERKLLAECDILLTGVRSGVSVEGIEKRAVTVLKQIGHLEASVLLLQEMSQGDVADPVVSWALQNLVVLLDALGRGEESRSAASRLRDSGGGTDAEVLLREIRWAAQDHAAGVAGAREKLESLVTDLGDSGPGTGEAYLYRGSARLLDDDLSGAEADFKKAFQAGMVDGKSATTFALSFARQGYFEKALGLLGAASQSDAVPVDWRLVEAFVLESQGEARAALSLYLEASQQEGALWQAKLLAIEARRRNEPEWDPTASVQEVMRSAVLTPAAFAECSLILGDHSLRKDLLPDARRWFEYAISSGLDGPDVLLRLALAQRGPGGDPERARVAFERVVSVNPKDADAWNALAEFQHRLGDLSAARVSVENAIAIYPEKLRESSAPDIPAALSWAQRSLRRIDRTLQEEYWYDDFEREPDSAIRNNWLEEEAFGISVSLHDGSVFMDGTQKYQPDRLTTMKRAILTPRLTGVRSTLRLISAGAGTRIAIRIEDQSGGGLVFFRDPDGVLGFAILGGSEVEMIRSDNEEQQEEYDLVLTSWSGEQLSHDLEIRFTEDRREGAEIWFDGIRVGRGISYRPARKRGLVGGISGQAPLDEAWEIEIESFEIFRRKETVTQEREF